MSLSTILGQATVNPHQDCLVQYLEEQGMQKVNDSTWEMRLSQYNVYALFTLTVSISGVKISFKNHFSNKALDWSVGIIGDVRHLLHTVLGLQLEGTLIDAAEAYYNSFPYKWEAMLSYFWIILEGNRDKGYYVKVKSAPIFTVDHSDGKGFRVKTKWVDTYLDPNLNSIGELKEEVQRLLLTAALSIDVTSADIRGDKEVIPTAHQLQYFITKDTVRDIVNASVKIVLRDYLEKEGITVENDRGSKGDFTINLADTGCTVTYAGKSTHFYYDSYLGDITGVIEDWVTAVIQTN